uniref:CChamide-like 2 n=1 Tax=Ophionotus victoriae TaxID=667017 RepID=A0A220W0J1_9ECHI|nr:CChamide-like 2 precursor [Ophionotus victoriae]
MSTTSVSITLLLITLMVALLPSAYSRGICSDPLACGAAFGKRTSNIQIPHNNFDDLQIPLETNRGLTFSTDDDDDRPVNMSFLQSLFKLLPQDRQQRIQQGLRQRMEDELFTARRR